MDVMLLAIPFVERSCSNPFKRVKYGARSIALMTAYLSLTMTIVVALLGGRMASIDFLSHGRIIDAESLGNFSNATTTTTQEESLPVYVCFRNLSAWTAISPNATRFANTQYWIYELAVNGTVRLHFVAKEANNTRTMSRARWFAPDKPNRTCMRTVVRTRHFPAGDDTPWLFRARQLAVEERPRPFAVPRHRRGNAK